MLKSQIWKIREAAKAAGKATSDVSTQDSVKLIFVSVRKMDSSAIRAATPENDVLINKTCYIIKVQIYTAILDSVICPIKHATSLKYSFTWQSLIWSFVFESDNFPAYPVYR